MYESGKLAVINIDDIFPNRFQPRLKFDEEKLSELSDSIRKYGVIQPIVVRPVNGKYEIIAGERRYKASVMAGRATIPAVIVNLSDRDSEEIALLENIQRQQLSPIEEAVSYKRILDMGYITQDELAKKLGKAQSTIANKVRLLNLDDEVQEALLENKISERHARSLLRLSDKADQVKMLQRIINERLTVKMTDNEIAKLKEEKNKQVSKQVQTDNNNIESMFGDEEMGSNMMDIDKISEGHARSLLRPSDQADQVKMLQRIYNERLTGKMTDNEIAKLKEEKNKQVNKQVQTDDNNIESLFGDEERGSNMMDIDKIMREAQDINAPASEKKDLSGLMKQDANTPVSPIITSEEPKQEPVREDGKFVNFSQIKDPEPVKPTPTPVSGGVTFDSMFHQEPSIAVPTPTPAVSTPAESMQNGSQVSTPTMQTGSPVEPVQSQGPTPVNSSQSSSGIGMAVADALKKFNTQVPNNEPIAASPSMTQVPPVNSVPINEVQATPVNLGQTPVQSEPSVSNQMVQPQSVAPTPASVNMNSFENSNVSSNETFNTSPNVTSESSVMEPQMNQGYVTSPNYSEQVMSPVNEPAQVNPMPANQSPVNEVQATPVNMGTENSAMPTYDNVNNIPDTTIYQEKPVGDASTMASSMAEPVKVAPAPQNNAHFAQVVRLIRDCANEIGKYGYKVNLDELDLGNKYQVSLTIDKE